MSYYVHVCEIDTWNQPQAPPVSVDLVLCTLPHLVKPEFSSVKQEISVLQQVLNKLVW